MKFWDHINEIESNHSWDYVEWESQERVRFDYQGDHSFWLNSDKTIDGEVPNFLKKDLRKLGFKI